MIHEGFHEWLEKKWQCDRDLTASFKAFSTKLKAWNKATFGNIFKRKKRNELRLKGVQ